MPYEIVVEPAPIGESLERIKSRLMLIGLKRMANLGRVEKDIAPIIGLRERSLSGDEPTGEQWGAAINNLSRALAITRDITRALAITRAFHFHLDLEVLDRDIGLDLDLVNDFIILMGDRLAPISKLDAAILSAIEVEKRFGLDMLSWHKGNCETTHCRAGSAIVLHPIGRELEIVLGPWFAGAVIYQKSTGRIPNFFASNEAAMTDIRECAAAQQ